MGRSPIVGPQALPTSTKRSLVLGGQERSLLRPSQPTGLGENPLTCRQAGRRKGTASSEGARGYAPMLSLRSKGRSPWGSGALAPARAKRVIQFTSSVARWGAQLPQRLVSDERAQRERSEHMAQPCWGFSPQGGFGGEAPAKGEALTQRSVTSDERSEE